MGNIMSAKNNDDLSDIDMAELIQMLKTRRQTLKEELTYASAYQELDRRIVKRLHEDPRERLV